MDHIYICWHWIELRPLHDLVTYFLVFYVTGFKFGLYIHLLTLIWTVTFTLPSDLLFLFFMLQASNSVHIYICWHWIEFWPWHDLVTYIFVFLCCWLQIWNTYTFVDTELNFDLYMTLWPTFWVFFMLQASNLDHIYICWHWIELWPLRYLVIYFFYFLCYRLQI